MGLYGLGSSRDQIIIPAPMTWAPVISMEAPWSQEKKDNAVRHGSHPPASILYWDFMLEGMLDMVKRGYWTILPYLTIKRLSGLKISLAGVVPQCARQLRPIIDYLFLAINQTTLWVVFGGDAVQPCFKCILENVTYANPCFGPVKVIKINLANGYYQVPVQHMWFFGSRSHLTNVCSECTHCITANTPHGLVRITPILLHVYRDHHGYFK